MRALQGKAQESASDEELAAVAKAIAVVFLRYDMLIGFSVQERTILTRDRLAVQLDGELCVADVSVHASPDFYATPMLSEGIAQTIIDLLEAHPGAGELLRGSTFARTFH